MTIPAAAARPFAVLVTDAETAPHPRILEVAALSADEARRAARYDLARRRQDDASIVRVLPLAC